jgi:predicted CoA-binding protein
VNVTVTHSQPDTIQRVLTQTHTWAVVGCSPDPSRDSHRIAQLLKRHGFRVIPVNPTVDELLGERCYSSVSAIPPTEAVDVVDIFRRADQAGAHVDQAIAAGAGAVWMQLGVIDEAAAGRALAAGLDVVMDRCPAIELPRLSH